MSIQQVAWVLQEEHTTSGRERLVLLAIANHDGDGGSWPSVATLAKEAHCSERNVQYAIRELQRVGLLQVIKHGGGDKDTRSDRRPNRYVILRPQRGEGDCTPSDSRGARSGSTGCKIGSHGVNAAAPEPSLEPSIEPRPENPTIDKRALSAARASLRSGLQANDAPTGEPA